MTDKEHQFSEAERDFLKEVTGNHPYLLQIAAGILIEAKENKENEPIAITKETFSDKAENLLTNILKSWPQKICKAFIYVAQDRDVSDFNSELKELKKQGFIREFNEGWRVRSSVFAEFVADKTVQELCQNKQSIKN